MAVKSCVTISLVQEARGGPFVFWDDLEAGCRKAAELGFDAIEVFAPAPDAVDPAQLRTVLGETGLKLATVGTGAGWLIRRLTLTHADAGKRAEAQRFIEAMIDLGGPFGAPAIIGSMQGRSGGDDGVGRRSARDYLAEALAVLGAHAAQYGVPLIYEPLNRYETDLTNTVAAGVAFLENRGIANVVLLADLFHMNIEEVDIAAALRAGGQHIGHVHFVDSNRRPVGCGHIDIEPVASALCAIGYAGYLSAEALPYPDSDEAARRTIEEFRRHFGSQGSTHGTPRAG
jgi:sugar phosphate isomerase/epimerase